MGQQQELNRIKKIISVLTEHTVERGFTESEALASIEKVGELLQNYNLTIADVFANQDEEKYKEYFFNTGRKNRDELSTIIVPIGRFCDCKVWRDYPIRAYGYSTQRNLYYGFFGLHADIEWVEYLMNMLSKTLDTATEEFKNTYEYKNPDMKYYKTLKGARRDASRSFRIGFCSRISNRLYKMKKEMDNHVNHAWEERKKNFTDRERGAYQLKVPTVLETSLVELKTDRREEKMTQLGYTFIKSYRSTIGGSNGSAYSAGQSAGNKVNLSRPLNGGSSTPRSISHG